MWVFPLAAIVLTVLGCFMPSRGSWRYVRIAVLITVYAGTLCFCHEALYLGGKLLTCSKS